MGLDLGPDPLPHGLQTDPAVDVVGDGRHHQSDNESSEQPADDETQEGELEQIEANVPTELGVGDSHVDPVGVQEPVLPLVGHAQTGDEGEQGGDNNADQSGPLPHERVVVDEQVLLRSRRTDGWGQALGDDQVPEEDGEEERHEQQHQDDLGSENGPKHRRVT